MKNLFRVTTIVILLLFVSCSDGSSNTSPSSDLILTELNGNAFKNSSEGLVVYFENNLLIISSSKIQNCWVTTALRAQIISHKSNEVVYNVTDQYGDFTVRITGSKSGITLRIANGEELETYSLSPTDDCIA